MHQPNSTLSVTLPTKQWTEARRPVLFTFDDGPRLQSTSQILDVLAAAGIRAVFFVVGKRLKTIGGKHLVSRMLSEGHVVGNHSYTHTTFRKMTRGEIVAELKTTQALLEDVGSTTRIFRPPYGIMTSRALEAADTLNLTALLWNVDTLDWNPTHHPTAWIKHGIDQILTRKESIVLLHDKLGTTASGMGLFLKRLKKEDCTFLPLAKNKTKYLLADPGMATQGPHGWIQVESICLLQPASMTRGIENNLSKPL